MFLCVGARHDEICDIDKKSSEAEAGSAGEQLARNSLIRDSDVAKRGLDSGPLFIITGAVMP
jgi:hypothetical protein